MSVRITQSMLSNNMLHNLNRSYRSMDKYQDQLSSGKKINRPSDDPVVASRGMLYRSSLNEIEQYKRNAEDGLGWIDVTDEALNQVTNALHRVRELIVQGSNETYVQTSYDAIAQEVKQLKEHIGEIANTMIGDRFIFAGTDTKTQSKPFDGTNFVNQNTDEIKWEVGQGNLMKVNVNGVDIFPDIFTKIDQIVTDLQSGVNPNQRLDGLDQQMDNLLKERAVVGANMSRMEMMISRLDKTEVTTTKLLSDTEDVDVAQVITELTAQENVHRAALSAGSRIIQPTLVDFLR
ncbi:flagellar hook-associated protein FlgL [Ammoniphilus resinae]|uniref:Flagellar hook-associated protein 3 FlgL n=1 Tax=Ammoniphilus resinae TaxID=861532 RepID=A0ABS4GMK1_9BACL|nr:flagellar hook-associated protein FlgL [Ammoniphilus resinae]MBP1931502.1 flagellar hook-associated protein 3 FlgL [Ammoniphilus resinae]